MDSITISCAACGVQFCVPTNLHKKLRETGESFYCPNGHSLSFKPSENDKLRREVQRLTRTLDTYKQWFREERARTEALERTVQAYRMNIGKARKRYESLLDERNAVVEERNDMVVERMLS